MTGRKFGMEQEGKLKLEVVLISLMVIYHQNQRLVVN
jgi:hypothetical protein